MSRYSEQWAMRLGHISLCNKIDIMKYYWLLAQAYCCLLLGDCWGCWFTCSWMGFQCCHACSSELKWAFWYKGCCWVSCWCCRSWITRGTSLQKQREIATERWAFTCWGYFQHLRSSGQDTECQCLPVCLFVPKSFSSWVTQNNELLLCGKPSSIFFSCYVAWEIPPW